MEKTYKLIQHLPSNEGAIQIFAYHDAIPSRQFLLRELKQARRDDLVGKFKPWKPREL